MPEPLTELERRVLDYLVQYLRRNTYQPSIREIGREFSIKSTKTVSELLQSLADKGWIERDPSRSRGVRLLGVQLHPDGVPMPLFAESGHSPVGGLILDRQFGNAGTYLLAMPDAHLVGIGILAGDLLLIEPVGSAELLDGDVVCGQAADRLVVRRLSRRSGAPLLEGATIEAVPAIPLAEIALKGRVTGLIRQLRAAPLAELTVPVSVPA